MHCICMHYTSRTDCWIAIKGKVYDVTPYLQEHPGGVPAIVMNGGKDATEDFEVHFLCVCLLLYYILYTNKSTTIHATDPIPTHPHTTTTDPNRPSTARRPGRCWRST